MDYKELVIFLGLGEQTASDETGYLDLTFEVVLSVPDNGNSLLFTFQAKLAE